MTTKHQYIVLKKYLTFTYFFMKFFGFWVYKTDNLNRHIRYNIFRVTYSIFFSSFLLCGYITLGRDFVNTINKSYFVSFAFQSVFFLHTNIILISYIALYVGQYFEFRKRQCAYAKCKEVLDLLKYYQFKRVNIKKYIVLFFIKTIVVDTFILIVLLMGWFANGFSQIYLLAFTYLPIIIVRFYTNLFYGGILIIEVSFKQLNTNLDRILLKARLSFKRNTGKERFYSKRKYGELTDELDALSIVYVKTLQATKAFNSVFSSQILFWIIDGLLVLVMRCFYQYIAIVELLNGCSRFVRIIRLFVVIFLAIFDLVSTSAACESVVTQVCTNLFGFYSYRFWSYI